MNILFEKSGKDLSLKVPPRMNDMMVKASGKLRVTKSNYIRLAIKDRLEKDLGVDLSK